MAEKLAAEITAERRVETDLIGPLPCFHARLNGISRWQIVLRGPDPAGMLRGKHLAEWRVEVDPSLLEAWGCRLNLENKIGVLSGRKPPTPLLPLGTPF